jgi:hypothetical protein
MNTTKNKKKNSKTSVIELPPNTELYCVLVKDGAKADIKIKTEEVYKYLQCTPQQLKMTPCNESLNSNDKTYNVVIYHKSNIITKVSEMKKQSRISQTNTDSSHKNINLTATYVALQVIYGSVLIASEEKFNKVILEEMAQRAIILIKGNPQAYKVLFSNQAFKASMLESGNNALSAVNSSMKLDNKSIKKLVKNKNVAVDTGKTAVQIAQKIAKEIDLKQISQKLNLNSSSNDKSQENDTEIEDCKDTSKLEGKDGKVDTKDNKTPFVIDPSMYSGLAAEIANNSDIIKILSSLDLNEVRKASEIPNPPLSNTNTPSITLNPSIAHGTSQTFSKPEQVEVVSPSRLNPIVKAN